MKSEKISHDDYREGFIVGYQAVRGVFASIPAIPAQPATRSNSTPFLMGVRKGIERGAGTKLT
jgi:hypothetical protein